MTGDGRRERARAVGLRGAIEDPELPGDADFFQRLNIPAPTREEACAIMARLMRDHVLSHLSGPDVPVPRGEARQLPRTTASCAARRSRKGSPVTWKAHEIEAGEQILDAEDGTQTVLTWDEVALDPGWCKLDWVVTDPVRKRLSNASNVIDVTWEAPDGEIVSLDGYLDAYFQEVYLDADSVPTFAKVAKFVSDDALDEYVERLEEEVHKYLTKHLNYGKAAKRMYNVFRLSGRHMDAAFVRELFDEPTTILYQVWSLISTLENATKPGPASRSPMCRRRPTRWCSRSCEALDGDQEAELVKSLLHLRQTLESQNSGEERIGRGGCGADAGGQPDQHLLPRPARRHADDQGVHRQDAGAAREH